MRKLFAKAGLAALVALTGLAAAAPTASAAGPDLILNVQYREHHRDWRPDRGPDWRHDRRRPEGCSPWFAEEKAARMGLRRTRVVDVSRRTVTVVGFDRRGPDRVVFANVRGCPVIRR